MGLEWSGATVLILFNSINLNLNKPNVASDYPTGEQSCTCSQLKIRIEELLSDLLEVV